MSERIIEQFMWGFQHNFRFSVEFEVERAFKEIEFKADARCILVGFEVTDGHIFPICVEQGEGLYKSEDLSGVRRLAIEKYRNNPESSVLHSHPRVRRLRQESLMNRMRAEAIEETLGSLDGQSDRIFFASNSVRVGDYDVHVIISTDKQTVARVPQIVTTMSDRMPVLQSLVHAVIWEILGRAEKALYLPEAGSGLNVLGASTGEIVRTATEHMLRTMMYCINYWFASDLHLLMNQLSALPYEGREGAGRLVLAKADNPAIDVSVKLASPVKSGNTLAIRKLLEGSGATADVLSDGEKIYGLGTVRSDYDPSTESVFSVRFLRRGYWELSHADTVLLAVRDGIPSLPQHVLDVEYLLDLCDRLFPESDDDVLVQAARAVGKHRHGAMLVISADAAGEAKRLSPQSWAVEPSPLSTSLLTQLTDMDGAVLLDTQGNCHAIGVILDGVAKGEGDPARGSRLNNAVRYLGSGRPATIVVVYSADGGIDVLPFLHPRVLKSQVHGAVAAYLDLAVQRPPELERVNRLWDAVKAFRFYLSAEQCNALNDARESIEEWRLENMRMKIGEELLRPNAKMDDSYWLPEAD
ncbi:diadenylate cyclase [Streptomyces dysideae]|uniref:diadenylate cyclase n=1 Tax=Streptomyces dysideae TaxID=909626 RepID=UPI000B10B287|nr:diadenylate cyclase [Streptomyces dysideae]